MASDPQGGRPLGLLSEPLEHLQPRYEIAVVGSGYGGSIAASRLARAGREVVLLEKGRELHPGEYPRTATAALAHMQCITGKEHLGDARALFSFHANGEINVLSGCGLGGTSLINANVSLRPDASVLCDPRWPKALRDDPQGLDAAYSRAAEILQPVTYPGSYPPLDKVDALRGVAGSLRAQLTPINVAFRAGANAVGIHQEACNGCGDCVTGCNTGAKNTLLMNYLPDAVAHGAKVFTEMEVSSVELADDGWVVHAQPLGIGREGFEAPPLTISAEIVVLAAGTLGTTAILLRSRMNGLALSRRLGDCFTGNGDILGFALRPHLEVNGVGCGPHSHDPEHPAGPCITSVIEYPGGAGPGSSIIIEDAVVPGALARLLPGQLAPQTLRALFGGRTGGGPVAMLESLLTQGRRGELEHLQTFLVMGNDDDRGRIVLDGERVRVSWPGCGESAYYTEANRSLSTLARNAGGAFLHNPIWTKLFKHDLITVHPLGGCVMADRAEDGVVDDRGRVFSSESGSAVHDGLYIWDGSVIPRPLGVNPLLTISAIAERAAALLAAEKGWEIDYGLDGGAVPSPGATATRASKPGLRFTEKMSGTWAPASRRAADLEDYEEAAGSGAAAARSVSFVLTLATDDLRAVTASLATPMTAMGTVVIPDISTEPMTVEGGSFELLVADDALDDSVRHMRYHLPLAAVDGARYHMDGFKLVRPGTVAEAWPDTSTLYVTLRAEGATGDVVGLGVLHIRLEDFLHQLRTMTVTGPVSEVERLELLERFGRAFAGPLISRYGTLLPVAKRLRRHAQPRARRLLDVPKPVVFSCATADGKALRLTRYRGGTKGPVILSHGMGSNPGLFTIGTVETNLLEYLTANGYDVWLQEWRASTWLPVAREAFNADEVARFDFPSAEAVVRDETGKSEIHWVAHCVAGITVSMAALAGTIRPASVVVSQVAAHPIGPRLTEIKAGVHAAALIRATGLKLMTTDAYEDESRLARLFDLALRAYPIPRDERCDQATCRRLAFIYGIAFHHPALNEATHLAIHELFGVTNLTMMNHLANCAAKKEVVSNEGADVYLPHLDRLQFPFTFLSGAMNLVWVPESTERTYELLVREFGAGNYRRHVFAGHGHGDCIVGADASRDVYPAILEHLERASA